EHVKTIVPTASLPDLFDLMFHNGSAEQRGATMHSETYWGYGYDDDFPQRPSGLPPELPWVSANEAFAALGVPPPIRPTANGRTTEQDLQNLCPSALTGTALGPYAYATGDRMAQATDYWTQRDHRQGGDGALAAQATGETRVQLDPPFEGAPSKVIELKTEPFPDDLRVSGLPQLKLPFEVAGTGGELAFWLFDEDAEGKVRAVMPC